MRPQRRTPGSHQRRAAVTRPQSGWIPRVYLFGVSGERTARRSRGAPALDRHRWTSRDELRIALVTWIERTYRRRRRQDSLGR